MACLWILIVTLYLFDMDGENMITQMPGESFKDPPPHLNRDSQELRQRLYNHVFELSHIIGTRNFFHYNNLLLAENYISQAFKEANYLPLRQEYKIDGYSFCNLEAEKKGASKKDEIIIIGAHYDSVWSSPGADDNASGVAVLIELARKFANKETARTFRFVAFSNEESPFFVMGSSLYAKRCKERQEKIIGMISLEMLGYYTNTPKSQKYPPFFFSTYPDTGNYIGFVANYASKDFLLTTVKYFRKYAVIPSDGLVASTYMPGVGLSDQWSFWRNDYPALMVTDTAFLRNPHYHKPSDTYDTLDYDNMARLTEGLEKALECLGNEEYK